MIPRLINKLIRFFEFKGLGINIFIPDLFAKSYYFLLSSPVSATIKGSLKSAFGSILAS